jgi:hypothetical protein
MPREKKDERKEGLEGNLKSGDEFEAGLTLT